MENGNVFFSGGEKDLCHISGGALTQVFQWVRSKDTLLLLLDERPGAAGRAGALRVGDDEDQVRLGELFSVVHPGWCKAQEGGDGVTTHSSRKTGGEIVITIINLIKTKHNVHKFIQKSESIR